MNTDQTLSLVRSLMKLIGGALLTHGATKAAAIVNAEDCIGLVMTIIGFIASHITHATDKTNATNAGKTAVVTLLLLLGLMTTARAQTDTNAPTVQGGVQTIVDALKSGQTNWWVEAHGLYAPALTKKYGGGMGVFWNLSQYVYTGVRVDYVNGGFWMPSGNATLQLPIKPFSWLQVAPLGYAGIGVPLSGATVGGVTLPGQTPKDNNGQPTAILGYGVAIRVYSRSSPSKLWYQPNGIDLLYDRETWSGFKGQQQRVGIGINWHF